MACGSVANCPGCVGTANMIGRNICNEKKTNIGVLLNIKQIKLKLVDIE